MGLLRMILPFFLCLPLQAGLYDIKDLEVLESNKAYIEFLDHAGDLRPSARTRHWSEMVGNMSVGLIKDLIKAKSYTKANFNYLTDLSRWPNLKKDSYFKHKRKEFVLSYLDNCLGPSCKPDLLSFWYSSEKQDGETTKKLALLLKQMDPKASLMPFLTVLGHDDYAFYHCKKEWIQSEIFALVTEPLRMDNSKKLQTTLNQLVGKDCWKSLRPVIHQALIRGSGLKQDYAYSLLKAKHDLPEEWEDFYYVSYFLGTPTPGPIFNMSWNRLKEIGQDYKRRAKVLNKLSSLDPLPGRLFSTIDSGKKKTLINFLNKNFPEYIDHYSKTCMSYLSGSVNFANGNPTPDCDNLVTGNYVEDKIRIQYSAIKH